MYQEIGSRAEDTRQKNRREWQFELFVFGDYRGEWMMTPRWHLAKSPDWLRAALDKARGYVDAEQRLAAKLVTDFLDGETVDTAQMGRALWALGGPVMYAIVWSEEHD